MKLFLSSLAPSKDLLPHLTSLIGKPTRDTSVALIENAADVYEMWVSQIRPALQSFGFEVEVVDLRKYRNNQASLRKKLDKDIIWIGGGNTYYVRWLLRETDADEIIKNLVHKGAVYGGDSAGAILAGPTTKHFETADDPNDAPEILYDGLNFTDSVVVPHFDNKKFATIVQGINKKLKTDKYKTVPLDDTHALVINDGREEII